MYELRGAMIVCHAGLTSRDSGPGPAAYNPELTSRRGGVSMGWRWQSNDDEKSPGPAYYSVYNPSTGAPAYTISGRPSYEYVSGEPGPADYGPIYVCTT